MDELEALDRAWDWAMAWAMGQSFGPWAYHGCVPPPWEDGGGFADDDVVDRLCKDCRWVWDLGLDFRQDMSAT